MLRPGGVGCGGAGADEAEPGGAHTAAEGLDVLRADAGGHGGVGPVGVGAEEEAQFDAVGGAEDGVGGGGVEPVGPYAGALTELDGRLTGGTGEGELPRGVFHAGGGERGARDGTSRTRRGTGFTAWKATISRSVMPMVTSRPGARRVTTSVQAAPSGSGPTPATGTNGGRS